MNSYFKMVTGTDRPTKVAHPTVLNVDVESGVARISQHMTPGVVGVIVGSTKFDIELVVLVAQLISTALFATELTCSALVFIFENEKKRNELVG